MTVHCLVRAIDHRSRLITSLQLADANTHIQNVPLVIGRYRQLLQALLNAELAPSSDALQTLLAAVMELPAYLRRVGTERRESPHDVLMVLNDLRALRGAAPLPPPPAELSFALDALHRDTGEQAPSASPEEMQLLRLARQRFQAELLGVLRRDASAQRLGQLVRVFALLAQRLGSTGHRLFWETAAAWVNALECAGVEPDEQALALLRELDGELRAGIALAAVSSASQ